MFYLEKSWPPRAVATAGTATCELHASTRSRDRLLNFNAMLPLIALKIISRDSF